MKFIRWEHVPVAVNGSTGFVPMGHGFDHSDEWVWESTFHRLVPSKVVDVGREAYVF
jgi:hypothetical protein